MAILKDHVWSCGMVQQIRSIVLHRISSYFSGEPIGVVEQMSTKIEQQEELISILVEHLYANGHLTTEQLGELVGNPELRPVER